MTWSDVKTNIDILLRNIQTLPSIFCIHWWSPHIYLYLVAVLHNWTKLHSIDTLRNIYVAGWSSVFKEVIMAFILFVVYRHTTLDGAWSDSRNSIWWEGNEFFLFNFISYVEIWNLVTSIYATGGCLVAWNLRNWNGWGEIICFLRYKFQEFFIYSSLTCLMFLCRGFLQDVMCILYG